jgi:hypothetical protein
MCLSSTVHNADRATYTPCDRHTEGACVRTKGNVTSCKEFLQYHKGMKELLKEYAKKGNIQLLPSQVHKIRIILLAENSLNP